MELEHRFDLPVGIDTAWSTLMDIQKVGPCFPGAVLDSVQRDSFSGAVKLKAGPARLTYKGTARIVERDDRAHRVRIEATGNEGSASTAAMLVTATAKELSVNRTQVDLVTTLSLTGRPAQFGRVMMVEVGNRLISQFADCVCTKLVGRGTGGAQLVDVENPDEIAAERELALSGPPASERVVGGTLRRSVRRTPGNVPELALGGTPASSLLTKVLPAVLAVVGAVLLRKLFGARNTPHDDELSDATLLTETGPAVAAEPPPVRGRA